MINGPYDLWKSEDDIPEMEDYYRGEIMMWAVRNNIPMTNREELAKRYWKEVYGLDV